MKMMSFLTKGFFAFVFLAFISSGVFAQSVEQKNEIRNLELEMKANQDNPQYDMKSAEIRLKQMATDYQNAVDAAKRKPVVLPESQQQGNIDAVSPHNTPEGRMRIKDEVVKYEILLQEVEAARIIAIEAGDETTKYDNYIKEYNSKLSELRSVLK